MQLLYGDKNLDSITFGGCKNNPEICFVFMNPTGKNITSSKEWKGIKSPWLGTKNVWKLFYLIGIIKEDTYKTIMSLKPKEWTKEFSKDLYKEVEDNKIFITNLAKCTQTDARGLSNDIYKKYLNLFWKEMNIIKPKKIILFGNQVSSIVLEENIKVGEVRKKEFKKNNFSLYSVYYPVGNGIFNMDKAIEDMKYIM